MNIPNQRRNLEDITKNRKEIKENIAKLKKEISIIKVSKDFKLNKEDKKKYSSQKKAAQENPSIVKLPYKNEKNYAIKKRQIQIKLYEHSLTRLICEEKGHIEASSHIASGSGGTRVYATCKRCGISYDRSLKPKESKDFYKFMYTPCTI